jgi:hypothetical protein
MPKSNWHGAGRVALFPVLVLLAAGCGSGPKIAKVTGTVTYLGNPVPGLVLHFVPAEGRASWGVTDQDGRYTLRYDRKTEGVTLGTHKVYFEYRPRTPSEETGLSEGKRALPAYLQDILARYGDEATTPLKRDVTKDGQVIDISLD